MLGALVQLLPREVGAWSGGARESQAQVGGQEMGVETNDVTGSGEGGGGTVEREGAVAQRRGRGRQHSGVRERCEERGRRQQQGGQRGRGRER